MMFGKVRWSDKVVWEHFEWPAPCMMLDGIKDGMFWEYVSSSYLNGLINYVKPYKVIMLERYMPMTPESKDAVTKALASCPHSLYRDYDTDDIIIFANGAGSRWFFWFDNDVSDCEIARISADQVTEQELFEAFLAHLGDVASPGERPVVYENGGGMETITGRYLELPEPQGWIRF